LFVKWSAIGTTKEPVRHAIHPQAIAAPRRQRDGIHPPAEQQPHDQQDAKMGEHERVEERDRVLQHADPHGAERHHGNDAAPHPDHECEHDCEEITPGGGPALP